MRFIATILLSSVLCACSEASDVLGRYAGVKKEYKNAVTEPTYCYKSWAEITCYNKERVGQKYHEAGQQLPPPEEVVISSPVAIPEEVVVIKPDKVAKKAKKKSKKKTSAKKSVKAKSAAKAVKRVKSPKSSKAIAEEAPLTEEQLQRAADEILKPLLEKNQ